MTRLPLIAVALLAGAAASVPTPAEPTTQSIPASPAAPAAVSGAPAGDQAVQAGWLDRYGVYNVRQGSWMLIPVRQGSWSLIPTDGC